MSAKKNITAIILAGGNSSRMGEDKGLMLLEGKPMIEHVIGAVSSFANKIIIVSNNEEYQQFNYPVYEDLVKGKGPLAGIYTGLYYSQTEENIILSCDVPYVTIELISFLIEKAGNHQITIPSFQGKSHQLIGVFSKSCEAPLFISLEKDHLKLKDAFKNLNLNVVDANQFDGKVFANLNSASDVTN